MGVKAIHSLTVLAPYLRKYQWRLIGILLLIVTVVGIDLSQPLIVKEAIDRHLCVAHPDYAAIARMSGIYLGVVLLAFALTYTALSRDAVSSRGLASVRHLAVPFGPFLALAALQWLLLHRLADTALAAWLGG